MPEQEGPAGFRVKEGKNEEQGLIDRPDRHLAGILGALKPWRDPVSRRRVRRRERG